MESQWLSNKDVDLVLHWLQSAGNLAAQQRDRFAIFYKDDITPYSCSDRLIESFLISSLRSRFPDFGILAEEDGFINKEFQAM